MLSKNGSLMKSSPLTSRLLLLALCLKLIIDAMTLSIPSSRPRIPQNVENFEGYSSIQRTPLILPAAKPARAKEECVVGELVTLKPKEWLGRFRRHGPDNLDDDDDDEKHMIRVTDLVYLPPMISLHAFDVTMSDGRANISLYLSTVILLTYSCTSNI